MERLRRSLHAAGAAALIITASCAFAADSPVRPALDKFVLVSLLVATIAVGSLGGLLLQWWLRQQDGNDFRHSFAFRPTMPATEAEPEEGLAERERRAEVRAEKEDEQAERGALRTRNPRA